MMESPEEIPVFVRSKAEDVASQCKAEAPGVKKPQ